MTMVLEDNVCCQFVYNVKGVMFAVNVYDVMMVSGDNFDCQCVYDVKAVLFLVNVLM